MSMRWSFWFCEFEFVSKKAWQDLGYVFSKVRCISIVANISTIVEETVLMELYDLEQMLKTSVLTDNLCI